MPTITRGDRQELRELVAEIAMRFPATDKPYCLHFYVGVHKLVRERNLLFEDQIERLESELEAMPGNGDRDLKLVMYCLEHVILDVLVPKMRLVLQETSTLMQIMSRAIGLARRSLDDEATIDVVTQLHKLLGELLDDVLVTSMETQMTGNTFSRSQRARDDETLKCLIEGVSCMIEDVSRGRYANVGAYTAVTEIKYGASCPPEATAQAMRKAAP